MAGFGRQGVGFVEQQQQRSGIRPLGQGSRQASRAVRIPQPDGDPGHGHTLRRPSLQQGSHPELGGGYRRGGNVRRREPLGFEALQRVRLALRPPEERRLAVAARAAENHDRGRRLALRQRPEEVPEEGLFRFASGEVRRKPSESRTKRTATSRSAHDGRSIGTDPLRGARSATGRPRAVPRTGNRRPIGGSPDAGGRPSRAGSSRRIRDRQPSRTASRCADTRVLNALGIVFEESRSRTAAEPPVRHARRESPMPATSASRDRQIADDPGRASRLPRLETPNG